MLNRNCDFCANGYKTNPRAGYYKLTGAMREALDLNSCQFDFICGDHFPPSCFDENGKLRAGARPSFFPRKECLEHNHNFYTKNCGVEEDIVVPNLPQFDFVKDLPLNI